MCTGKFQFRKPGAVEGACPVEKDGVPCPVILHHPAFPNDQRQPDKGRRKWTTETTDGFSYGSTPAIRRSAMPVSPLLSTPRVLAGAWGAVGLALGWL